MKKYRQNIDKISKNVEMSVTLFQTQNIFLTISEASSFASLTSVKLTHTRGEILVPKK